jgi:hypothetical protein
MSNAQTVRREERPFPHTNHPGKGTSSSYFVSFFSEQSVVEENVNSGKGLCANLQYIFSSRSGMSSLLQLRLRTFH